MDLQRRQGSCRILSNLVNNRLQGISKDRIHGKPYQKFYQGFLPRSTLPEFVVTFSGTPGAGKILGGPRLVVFSGDQSW
jgi:hypothetical protein